MRDMGEFVFFGVAEVIVFSEQVSAVLKENVKLFCLCVCQNRVLQLINF